MQVTKLRRGQKVKFQAVRITEGNPVEGTVTWSDSTSFAIVLDHAIYGMGNTMWQKGAEKIFRWDLVDKFV